jgi:hypothetical protein
MPDSMADRHAPLLAALFAIAIRVPFLGAGYGWDSDAWRMAAAARQIAKTGQYTASRSPGYPLTELADAALVRLGNEHVFEDEFPAIPSAWATNGLRALWAGLAAASFAVLARRVRAPSPLLLACAFTSVPPVFIAGTSTLDAMPSLACGVTAVALATSRRPFLAGVATGIAAGLRPTGLLFVLPVAATLRGRDALVAVSTALVVGLLGYVPALLTGGLGTFTYYDLGYPSIALVLKHATLDLWGPLGLAGLAAAAGWTLVRPVRGDGAPGETSDRRATIALATGCITFLALYLRLPYKALYLLPMVPFALLLLARCVPRLALTVIVGCLIASPWIGSLYEPGKADDPPPSRAGTTLALRGRAIRAELRGAAWMDRLRRERGMGMGFGIVRAGLRSSSAIIVAGDWLPMIRVMTDRTAGPVDIGRVRFVHHLEASDIELVHREGRAMYVAPGALGSPSVRFGVDPATLGAEPLFRLDATTKGVTP